LDPLGSLSRPDRRRGKDIIGHFPDPVVQLIVETNLKLIDHYDPIIKKLDKQILDLAKEHDPIEPSLAAKHPWRGRCTVINHAL
jgi:hypothetical protein